MFWIKFTISTLVEYEEIIGAALTELGINDIEIKDNVQISESEARAMFADVLPKLPKDDGCADICFYRELDTKDYEPFLKKLKELLAELKEIYGVKKCALSFDKYTDFDYENSWKDFFSPIVIEDIVIKPSWAKVPNGHEQAKLINIDPGLAFGTGSHETTKMCVRALKDVLRSGDIVLDIGCGTGILSICALKCGAGFATCIDIDEKAVEIAHENLKLNHMLSSSYELFCENILEESENAKDIFSKKYDIVLANIYAPVIEELLSKVPLCMRAGAYFIASGVMKEHVGRVLEAAKSASSLELVSTYSEGSWLCYLFKKA